MSRGSQTIAILNSSSKRTNRTVATDEFCTIQFTVRDVDVNVSKQIRLTPRSATPVTVFYTDRCPLRFEPSMTLTQDQLLSTNCIWEIMPNTSFLILITIISAQHAYIFSDVITREQCNNLIAIVSTNQSPSTFAENIPAAAAVSIVQSKNENTSSFKRRQDSSIKWLVGLHKYTERLCCIPRRPDLHVRTIQRATGISVT